MHLSAPILTDDDLQSQFLNNAYSDLLTDTKCLQFFISTGMSHYMYVPGSLRPLASTKYISYMNLIVVLCRKYHSVCAGRSMDL